MLDEQGEQDERGSDSGSGAEPSGSGDSGSAVGDRSNGSASRDGGDVSRDGGDVSGNGSGDSGSGNGDGSADSGGDSFASADTGKGDAHRTDVRRTRADRIRERRTIRLGGNGRDRDSADSAGDATRTGDTETRDNGVPVIRLGAKGRGRPKEKVDTDSGTTASKSDIKKYVSTFLDSIFEIPAYSLKQEFWKLDSEENKTLTEAICAYIDSLPKSKSNWLTQFITEHFPLINLCMIGFFIVSQRVQQSIAIATVTKAAKNSQFSQARNAPEGFGGRFSTEVADNIH